MHCERSSQRTIAEQRRAAGKDKRDLLEANAFLGLLLDVGHVVREWKEATSDRGEVVGKRKKSDEGLAEDPCGF